MAGYPFATACPEVVGVRLDGALSDWVQAKDVILELLRRFDVRGGVGKIFEFHGDGVARPVRDGAGDDLQHDRRDGRDDGGLPERRAGARVARGAGPGARLGRAGRRSRCRVRPARGDRPRRARALDREAPFARQRRARGRACGNEDGPGLRRLLGQLVLRGSRDRRGGHARRDALARVAADRDARVAADPRHDRAERRLPRPRRRRRARPRAGVRPVHRRRPGSCSGPALRADVQPQLPRAQRDGGRRGVPLLACDRRRDRPARRDHRSAHARRAARDRGGAERPVGRRPAHPRAAACRRGARSRDRPRRARSSRRRVAAPCPT